MRKIKKLSLSRQSFRVPFDLQQQLCANIDSWAVPGLFGAQSYDKFILALCVCVGTRVCVCVCVCVCVRRARGCALGCVCVCVCVGAECVCVWAGV